MIKQKFSKWIGVDLDGTLAHYEEWGVTKIGDPIAPMVARIKKWLVEGKDVRICTARMNPINHTEEVLVDQRRQISEWCIQHIGQALPLTYMKDAFMEELWDDRAVQIIKNTGLRADGRDE